MSEAPPTPLLGSLLRGALVGTVVLLLAGSRVAPLVIEDQLPPPRLRSGGGEALLADLDRLGKLGFFKGRGTTADAAPTLNLLVGADHELPGMAPAPWATAGAFAPLESFRTGEEWLDHPELTGAYDVSFLADLRRFDHWTWDGTDPFAGHVAARASGCAADTPFPEFGLLLWVAKVRVAQGYHAGELGVAMAEAEHLASLLASTDTLVGTKVAIQILGMEDRVAARAMAERPLESVPTRGWTEADRDALTVAILAEAAVFASGVDAELAATIARRSDELPGACAAIFEGVSSGLILRHEVERPWPGEADHSALATSITNALILSKCPLPLARSWWTAPSRRYSCSDVPTPNHTLELKYRLPFLRAPAIALLRGVAPGPYSLGPYGKDVGESQTAFLDD
ncbi:hypothetical protein LBMAG42_14750 [Deltaproteobacteria bacterium]|nr:hypothetical protein LBMAG42_14750 [Deltaproteobacteria bacterium]